jgi:transcriptional regulator with GAF, ATPase, and Fis domain
LDTSPPDKRALWVAGGLQAVGPGSRPFTAEVTVSRFEMRGHRFLTLILRNVNDRIQAERQISQLKRETEYLREEIRYLDNYAEIVGESKALKTVLRSAAQVAATDSTVLIQGETGTGKELVARYVHRHSPRAEGAFITLNCAALQPNLVESEFFGHEEGAFTGATQQRQGRFELADGGTIFLDEVSEIPLELQAKLLRVLQEGQFERVGGVKTRKVDVRVIAATNRQLNAAVVGGKFRADLFYRLNVYPITVPPLRARREDIPPLVHHFASRIAARMGKKIETIPAATMDSLIAYDWPGNVRELRNVIERAIITSSGPALFLPETLEAVSAQTGTARRAAPIRLAGRRGAPPHRPGAAGHGLAHQRRAGGRGSPGAKPLHPALPHQKAADPQALERLSRQGRSGVSGGSGRRLHSQYLASQ